MEAVRVLVADDSAVMRQVLADGLTAAGMEVVGTAADGEQAIRECMALRPDVLTLDVQMPELDGNSVLRALARLNAPTRVVVVSGLVGSGAIRAVDLLAAGAIDVVAKPGPGDAVSTFLQLTVERVAAAASVPADRPRSAGAASWAGRVSIPSGGPVHSQRALIIASSTGGPQALTTLLPALPAPLGRGGLIIQHMPTGFTAPFAERLNAVTDLAVREAATGDRLEPGLLLLAQGGRHLRVASTGRVRLADDPPRRGVRPCADYAIEDAVAAWGSDVVLVVLTGMGRDATEGGAAVRDAGGIVLAQSDALVPGMPGSIIKEGLASSVVPLAEMPAAITQAMSAAATRPRAPG
jgi:two-component system chemotaxis response regulator CheB